MTKRKTSMRSAADKLIAEAASRAMARREEENTSVAFETGSQGGAGDYAERRHALPKAKDQLSEAVRATSRTAGQTRLLALALQRSPVPLVTKKDIGRRLNIGPDSVRKLLQIHGVDPGAEKDHTIPLTDCLLCEGVGDPLDRWVMATHSERAVLQADLMTEQELKASRKRKDESSLTAAASHSSIIRVGRLKRYRPDFTPSVEMPPSRRDPGQ